MSEKANAWDADLYAAAGSFRAVTLRRIALLGGDDDARAAASLQMHLAGVIVAWLINRLGDRIAGDVFDIDDAQLLEVEAWFTWAFAGAMSNYIGTVKRRGDKRQDHAERLMQTVVFALRQHLQKSQLGLGETLPLLFASGTFSEPAFDFRAHLRGAKDGP